MNKPALPIEQRREIYAQLKPDAYLCVQLKWAVGTAVCPTLEAVTSLFPEFGTCCNYRHDVACKFAPYGTVVVHMSYGDRVQWRKDVIKYLQNI